MISVQNVKLCFRHYQHAKYKERLLNAVRVDPAEALKCVSAGLKNIKKLRDGGYLDQIEFASMQHTLLGVSNRLIGITSNDFDTQEMAAADEAYSQRLIAAGAVEAESPEEARMILEARRAQQLTASEKPKLTTGEKPECDKKQEGDKIEAA